MSMGILGRKVGMTQVFDAEGKAVPVTVVEAGPCQVVEVRTMEKNGYSAVQLGFGEANPRKLSKPMKGYFAKNGVEPKRWLREFRVDEGHGYEKGQEVRADLFSEGEVVDVIGVSKGKGYAGVMKRFNFGGGPASHGSSKFHRQPGSSGANSYPGHIFKGKTMPGRMGGERVTVKNLRVFAVDVENNLILLRGAIPGAKDGLVLIRKASV
ncbi:50S ribosomal protein L3, bacterial [Thermanaerovibrio velox DSM 12556]|uniref:Large ribosomal subunit protein uL3 n=1 Tax=Thermanaerovibrio velox DSM 12556 TaxID=926567 RepID=H0UQI5_9BACT|nr:50S ribosomal protein L3 [Thermanaerovibrio velox]EHM09739.1 50S ribosomal protein L3, bacterial [Thermanaerovibrio velox DSM 12556]